MCIRDSPKTPPSQPLRAQPSQLHEETTSEGGKSMFRKVMWATDGSDAADRALPLAKALAADGGGELLVAHCEELTMPGKAGGSFPVHADEGELKVKIERQVAELSEEGVSA